MTKQTNPIYAAVEVYRAPAIQRAKERAAEMLDKMYAALAAADWNLDVVAPEPRSMRDSKREYHQKKAARAAFLSIASRDKARCDAAYREFYANPNRDLRERAATFVQRDQELANRYIKHAADEADAAFFGYVSKLTAKVGEGVVKAEVDNGSLWTHSILTITKADGSIQRWKTQCIINVSVLGKLFNQWPTRLLKD